MLAKVAEYLSLQLVSNQVIKEEDKEIYIFGIKMMFTQSAHALLVVLLGYWFGLLYESIIFLFTYMPLRIYAGGYHASSNIRCFISSGMMMVMVLLTISLVPTYMVITTSCLLAFFSLIIIFQYAPVENKKKLLDAAEKMVYKKKAYKISMGLFISMFVCFFYEYYSFGLSLALSLFCECVLILIEIRKTQKNKVAIG